MSAQYRPLRSGRRLLAQASLGAILVAAGVYAVLDRPRLAVPAPISPPDTAQRFTKTEPAYTLPAPKSTPVPVPAPGKAVVARRAAGSGVYKCEEPDGGVGYSQFPCDEGTQVNTSPTSGGFNENWSISVKQR